MENGVQATIIESLKQQLDKADPNFEYEYIPNEILKFIRDECYLKPADLEFLIPAQEQEFLNKVHHGQPINVRRAARQTGGTTLMFLIAVYYTIKYDKTCVYVSENNRMIQHAIDQALYTIGLFKYKLSGFNKGKIGIDIHPTTSAAWITRSIHTFGGIENAIVKMRGGPSYDIILVDSSFRNTQSRDEYLIHLRSNLNYPGAKMIVNESP
jgi:hypothetical protein